MSLNINSADLYKSILYRAADIYEVEYEDVERDIGQQFDPIVRFMAGAVASELEGVYQHLYDTESRLQKRLAKVLLPEYFHLPQPAHALATAKAASEAFMINETTSFVIESDDGSKADLAFTPLFPSNIIPAEVKLIATETQIIEVANRPRIRRGDSKGGKEEVRKIVLGFESSEAIINWQGVSLFFDLRGGSSEDSEKALFFAAIPDSKCALHGQPLNSQKGLPQNELILEDYLNGNERLQSQVRARYEHHFLTFTDEDVDEVAPILALDFLPKWFAKSMPNEEDVQASMAKLNPDLNKPLYWLEVRLSRPVEIMQIAARLSIRMNVFPVVNRRLNGNGKGEHHYLRNNSIKWVPLKPKEDFISIRKVFEEKPPEYQTFTFKPFADFKDEKKPAYTLRHGGVGRWDDFNAWQRLAYVVRILQENYKHNELIQESAAALSLEDVHHLLGKKISKTAQDEKPERDIYVLLHAGISAGIRVRVEYWTSVGTEANKIPAKSILKCVSKEKASFDGDAMELITSTTDGRNPLNSTEQLNAMKSALLSRGRIVTREDVKIFCKSFLEHKLLEVKVMDGVGTDPRFDFGMTRLLEVQLKPDKKALKEDWQGICRQVQTLLEQKSTSSIPIKVVLAPEFADITR